MKEQAIVKFLVELLKPEHIRVNNNVYFVISSDKVDKPEIFDPINRIEHTWAVEDAIAKIGEAAKITFSRELTEMFVVDHPFMYGLFFAIAHASPERRCVAAIRALATPAQIKSWL